MKKYISIYYFYDVFVSNQDYQSLYNNVVGNIQNYFENIGVKNQFTFSEKQTEDYSEREFIHLDVDIANAYKRPGEDFQLKTIVSIQKDLNILKLFMPIIRVDFFMSDSFKDISDEVVEEFLDIFEGNFETKWIWESEYFAELETDLIHLADLKRIFDKNKKIFYKILNGKIKYQKDTFDPKIRKFNQMLIYFIYLIYANYKTISLFESKIKDIRSLKQDDRIIDEHMDYVNMTDKRLLLNHNTAQKVFKDYQDKLKYFLEVVAKAGEF